MKIATLLRTAATWLTDHRDQIGQVALAILAGLWKFAKLLIGMWIAFVGPFYVYRLWAGLDGDPEKEALVISILFFVVALAFFIRDVFRLITWSRQAPADGVGMGVVALASRPDHDEVTLLSVAQHEARHAVIADVLGHTVTEIQTRATGSGGGHVRFDPAEGVSRADEHWHNLLILFAPIGINDGCAQSDDVRAFSHLTQIIGAGEKPTGYDGMLTLSVLHRAAIARARELVDEHQVAILRLTGVLLEERSLAGDRLAEEMRKIRNTPSAEELIAQGRAGSVDGGARDDR